MKTWRNETFDRARADRPGPWDAEPDKAQWVDEETGLDCLIVRNRLGALCGYVGVPPEHVWHGIEYNECTGVKCDNDEDDWHYECSPVGRVEVHGGLTFSGSCQDGHDPSVGICHVPEPGRPDDVWWFGFDCAHSMDFVPAMGRHSIEFYESYKTIAYVKAEVALLANQLEEVTAL